MPNPAESATKKLADEMGSWKSIEFRLSEAFENKDPDRKPSEPRTFRASYHYVESAVGQRLYENRLISDLNPETLVSIDYTDGSKCAFLYRRDKGDQLGQDQVTIKRWFGQEKDGVTHRPEPLRYLYVGLKPLYEVLSKGTPDGEGRRLDRNCDRFLFRQVSAEKDPSVHLYWLDRDTGITLRYEYFENQEKMSQGHPYYLWNAESIDTVDGHHLVRKSELLMFKPNGPSPSQPVMHYQVSADEVFFDRDYSATTFWPTISKQTKVIDMVANKIVIPRAEVSKTSSTADPIRAVDPVGWNSSYSLMGLLLAATVVGVGLSLYRNKR